MRGGYTTTNWLASNPVVNPTILDAASSGRVVYLTGGSSVNVGLDGLTLRNGNAGGGDGGGIYSNGTLTVTNSFIRNALNASRGGGIFNETGRTMRLDTITVENNATGYNSGGVGNFGALTLVNSRVMSNTAGNNSGGIGNWGVMTVTNSTISGNSGPGGFGGGGVLNGGGGTLALYDSTIRANSTSGNDAPGGGLASVESASTMLRNCTISGNSASYGGGAFAGIGLMSVINSTLSDNHSTGNGPTLGGGAITYNPVVLVLGQTTVTDMGQTRGPLNSAGDVVEPQSTSPAVVAANSVTLINNTIVNNTAVNTTRSGIWLAGGTLNIANSIVANNNGTNNVAISGGTFTSQGYNLTNSGAGTPFTAPTDLISTNPLLGPLQDNGGSTWTQALLLGSPAIDRIPNGMSGCGTTVTSDQRGQPRPGTFTRLCDIGAYEAQNIHYLIYLPLVALR